MFGARVSYLRVSYTPVFYMSPSHSRYRRYFLGKEELPALEGRHAGQNKIGPVGECVRSSGIGGFHDATTNQLPRGLKLGVNAFLYRCYSQSTAVVL